MATFAETKKKTTTEAQLQELRDTISRLERELRDLNARVGEITWEDLSHHGDEALKALGAQETKRNAIPVALAKARVTEQELLGRLLDEEIETLGTQRDAQYEKFVAVDEVYQRVTKERNEALGNWQDLGHRFRSLRLEKGAVKRERERLEAEATGAAERAGAPIVRLGPSFMQGAAQEA
jgi:chromosome segregation ATPase